MQETHGAFFFLPALFRRLNGRKPKYRKFSFRPSIPFHFQFAPLLAAPDGAGYDDEAGCLSGVAVCLIADCKGR